MAAATKVKGALSICDPARERWGVDAVRGFVTGEGQNALYEVGAQADGSCVS